MIQRKQTLYILAAIIMTVICLCMQIGSFKAVGLEVAKVYNLWFTDPLGKHHFDTWPLFAVLLPTTALVPIPSSCIAIVSCRLCSASSMLC